MSLRMKLTGVKPQYVMDVHRKFECSIFNGSRDITLGTGKGQTFSFNLFVSISVSFSLSVSVSLFQSGSQRTITIYPVGFPAESMKFWELVQFLMLNKARRGANLKIFWGAQEGGVLAKIFTKNHKIFFCLKQLSTGP